MNVLMAILFAASGTAWNILFLGSAPLMGSVIEVEGAKTYSVILDIALEQYLNGERDGARDQQWFLQCNLREGSSTYCKLARTALDFWGEETYGTVCSQTEHSTLDGTLELLAADWEKGRLDFNLVHGDQSRTHVLIDMEFGSEGAIYLRSLKASNTSRGPSGEAYAMEFRVPKYSYIRQVPIVMKGMRPTWDKSWDDMVATLAVADQEVLRRFVADRDAIFVRARDRADEGVRSSAVEADSERATAEAHITNDEKVKEGSRSLLVYLIDQIEEWLEQAGMTPSGREAVISFLREQSPG